MALASSLPLAAAAVTIEAVLGYPDTIFRAIRHPVMWIGALIAALDATLNDPSRSHPARRRRGVFALLAILITLGAITLLIQHLILITLPRAPALIILAVLASTLLASRSLTAHVRAVADGLDRGGLAAGRIAVAHIVGRDPASLDAPGVARAAIESLAENFSDGVVAPLFWCALFGLPGIALYKAVNTADSMIGHLTPRHAAFGWAAARFDDLLNLPASRLAAFWIVLAAAIGNDTSGIAAIRALRRDAGRHRSPNAGWPEAAMAGALGLRLAGPRIYQNETVDDPWLGDGTTEAKAADIARALAVIQRAAWLQIGAIWLITVLLLRGARTGF